MKLKTNFKDYYDHMFTNDGKTFNRSTLKAPNKVESLAMLKAIGFQIPQPGVISNIYDQISELYTSKPLEEQIAKLNSFLFCVCKDVDKRGGDNVELMGLYDANQKYRDAFATTYKSTSLSGHGQTYKMFAVGDSYTFVEYESRDNWRSNRGDFSAEIVRMDNPPVLTHIKVPLYTVDFIKTSRDMIALDFDTAPTLEGTPIQETMSPEEVYELIEKKVNELSEE